MEPDLVEPVVVEVTDVRVVPGVTEEVGEVGGAETAFIGTQFVDDVDPAFGRAVDADRVTAVPVEVTG
jgi:hypothetical protein